MRSNLDAVVVVVTIEAVAHSTGVGLCQIALIGNRRRDIRKLDRKRKKVLEKGKGEREGMECSRGKGRKGRNGVLERKGRNGVLERNQGEREEGRKGRNGILEEPKHATAALALRG